MLWLAHDVATYSDHMHGATWVRTGRAPRWTWLAGRRFRDDSRALLD